MEAVTWWGIGLVENTSPILLLTQTSLPPASSRILLNPHHSPLAQCLTQEVVITGFELSPTTSGDASPPPPFRLLNQEASITSSRSIPAGGPSRPPGGSSHSHSLFSYFPVVYTSFVDNKLFFFIKRVPSGPSLGQGVC